MSKNLFDSSLNVFEILQQNDKKNKSNPKIQFDEPDLKLLFKTKNEVAQYLGLYFQQNF